MESFEYKCPNCSAPVEYNYEKNKWICGYCNNTYDNIFASSKVKEDYLDAKDEILKINIYHCDDCNVNVYGIENEAKCKKCNKKLTNIVGSKELSTYLKRSVHINSVNYVYNSKYEKIHNYLPMEFANPLINEVLIESTMYTGTLELIYNKKSEKYVFANLIVPNPKNEDYKLMYEIGNRGLNYDIRETKNLSKKYFERTISRELNDIEISRNEKRIIEKKDLIDYCKKQFMKKYSISKEDKVIVNDSIEEKKELYIPTFELAVNKDNKTYYQYHIKSSNINDYNEQINNFPEKENARKLTRNFIRINEIFRYIGITAFIASLAFAFGAFVSYNNAFTAEEEHIASLFGFGLILLITTFIISIIIYNITSKKIDFYKDSFEVTREDYLKQIIENSNYVEKV